MATNAVIRGCIPCLDFARSKGCPSWHYAVPELACILGRLDCLQYAVRNGATAGYFTVRAALCYETWECLDWALRNGCPVSCDDDGARPRFVRAWVGDIVRKAVDRAEREAAARTLQTAWLRAYYHPAQPVCGRRLAREYEELSALL